MKKQRQVRKLTIHRETLQNLEAPQSARVAGGTGIPCPNTWQITCPVTCIEGVNSCIQCGG